MRSLRPRVSCLATLLTALVAGWAFAPDAAAQCPPVNGLPAQCHTLITVHEFNVNVAYTGAPPYEIDGAGNLKVDTLVGVSNVSTEPLRALRVKGLTPIFDFDGSGVDTFGVVGNPLDTTGYGGPNAFFTDISADKTAGTVNFIVPI